MPQEENPTESQQKTAANATGARDETDTRREIQARREAVPESAPGSDEQVKTLQDENRHLSDRMLRLAAELDNRRKRELRTEAEAERRGREAILLDLVGVADDLERAAASLDTADPAAIREGISLITRALQQRLERLGVRPLEAEGQPFDPRLHDAVDQVPSQERPPGTVLRVTRKGYMAGDRLLRPAAVQVSTAPPQVVH